MDNLFTVIIPTFNHTDTIRYSIKSVLNQTYQNFEIIVVGDGAPKKTLEIMTELCVQDHRISYQPHEKGQGHGEYYRHEAIKNSNGQFICYLGDDDMWLPNHLSTVKAYLKYFDFVHTYHTGFTPEKKLYYHDGELESSDIQNKMLHEKWNFFGPTCVAHSREAYFKLPFGWRPRPAEIWSDLYMWRQWLRQEQLRFLTIPVSTTLHFPTSLRQEVSIDNRVKELKEYYPKTLDSNYSKNINKQLIEIKTKNALNDHGGSSSTIEGRYSKLHLYNTSIIRGENEVTEQITKLKKTADALRIDYINLKNSFSSRIGFFITSPFRFLYEFFRKNFFEK